MDINIIEKEITSIINNLENIEGSSKEYSAMVTNAQKLQQISGSIQDNNSKKNKEKFDEKMRKNLYKLEKDKVDYLHQEKVAEAEYLHQEKMEELRIAGLKAENEHIILIENQKRAEKEFKAIRRRDWCMFGLKVGGGLLTVTFAFMSLCNQLHFERVENGIVSPRCGKYDNIINKTGEIFMK